MPPLRKEFAREALIVSAAAAIGAAMWFASAPAKLFEDYLKSSHPTGAAILAGNEGLVRLYQRIDWVQPPVMAWLWAPFGSLSPLHGALLYLTVGMLAALGAVLLLAHLSPSPHRRWVPLALFLVSGPLIYSLRLGNSSHLVLLGLVGAVMLLGRGRGVPAGVLIGVSSMLKYPLLVLIIWLALRRKWTAAIAAVATILLILLLSLIEFGPGMIRLWYDCCIGPYSKQPVAAINAQTLHAFVVRLMTGATWLGDFRPVPVTPALVLVRYVAAALILGALAIAARAPRSRQWDLLTFSIALVVAIVASPVAWSHYYTMLLLPFALYFIGDLELPPDRFTARAMVISALLCSLPVIHLRWLFGPVTSRTVVSSLLVGACILLVVMVRAVWLRRTALGSGADPSTVTAARTPGAVA